MGHDDPLSWRDCPGASRRLDSTRGYPPNVRVSSIAVVSRRLAMEQPFTRRGRSRANARWRSSKAPLFNIRYRYRDRSAVRRSSFRSQPAPTLNRVRLSCASIAVGSTAAPAPARAPAAAPPTPGRACGRALGSHPCVVSSREELVVGAQQVIVLRHASLFVSGGIGARLTDAAYSCISSVPAGRRELRLELRLDGELDVVEFDRLAAGVLRRTPGTPPTRFARVACVGEVKTGTVGGVSDRARAGWGSRGRARGGWRRACCKKRTRGGAGTHDGRTPCTSWLTTRGSHSFTPMLLRMLITTAASRGYGQRFDRPFGGHRAGTEDRARGSDARTVSTETFR